MKPTDNKNDMSLPHPLLLDSRAERRESNFELLRIIAMSAILWIHFIRNGGPVFTSATWRTLDFIAFYGVDVFILISGWFTIRTTWRSLLRLWLYTLLMIVVPVGVYTLIKGSLPSTWHMIGNSMAAPLSGSTLWFIGVYFALMLVAPILNRGVRGISIHNWRVLIIALSFLEFYGIGLFCNPVDKFGATLYNFVYLYLLGHYLRIEPGTRRIPLWALIAVLVTVTGTHTFFQYHFLACGDDSAFATYAFYTARYNSLPRIVIGATLVLAFSRWHFKSKIINSIAAASLGCYILQDGLLRDFWYGTLCGVIDGPAPAKWVLPWLLSAFAMYVFYWVASYILTALSRLFIPALARGMESILPSWLKPEKNAES